MNFKKINTIIRTSILFGMCSAISLSAVSPLSVYAANKQDSSITLQMSQFNYDENNKYYDIDKKIDSISGNVTNGAKEISYKIADDKGIIIKEGQASVNDNNEWSITDLGFVLGKNTITIAANGESESINIYNENIDNSENLNVDMNDDDNDGLVNYWEEYFGADKNNMDTDGDGISDKDEIIILGTDPLKYDTSGNGKNDGDEDFDKDGLLNKDEIRYGTNPYLSDTDNDSLSDFDEINKYKTNPSIKDTDNDGASDGWEINNNYNPLAKDDKFTVSAVSEDNKAKFYSNNASGSSVGEVSIAKAEEVFLEGAAGAKSSVYKTDGDIPGKISIEYSIDSQNEKPEIYEYDMDENKFKVLETTSENGWLSADINGKANVIYIVIDSLKYESDKNTNNNQNTDETDSNKDGISDADTLKMCNGELLTSIGGKVFGDITYDEIMANDDFDNDGIKNGDEIKIVKGNDISHVELISSPVSSDSDNDGILDSEDTAPLERGLKDGIIGAVQIYARHNPNESFMSGHSFLVFTSYVNDETIAIDNLNRIYDYDKENDKYILREDKDDSYTLQRGDYVSIGNYRSSGFDVAYDSVKGDYEALWTDSGLSEYLDKDNLTLSDLIAFGINGDAAEVAGNIIKGFSDTTIRFNEEIYDTYAYENFTQTPNGVLTKEITQEQLDKILEYDENHNYYNILTNNCSSIATGAWNLAFDDNLSPREEEGLYSLFDTPMVLKSHILEREGSQKDLATFGVEV